MGERRVVVGSTLLTIVVSTVGCVPTAFTFVDDDAAVDDADPTCTTCARGDVAAPPIDAGTDAPRATPDAAPSVDGCAGDVHHDGFGGTFADCVPPGSWSATLAYEASLSAWPPDAGSTYASIAVCGATDTNAAWAQHGADTSSGAWWVYAGPFAGRAFTGSWAEAHATTNATCGTRASVPWD